MSAGCAHSRRAPARLELAHILRARGPAYAATHRLAGVQHRAVADICACRTEAMGARHFRCDACGEETLVYCSCGNRHCPKCQSLARERWLCARQAELLPVPYFHVVFTLPHELNVLAQANARVIYDLLFEAASRTLLEFGANPRWLGGKLAITLVLHTWGQNLSQHLHVHALVSGGALSPDGAQFIRARRGFLFPVQALSKVFRGKYLAALEVALVDGALRLGSRYAELAQSPPRCQWLQALRAQDWVVYVKPPFAGPESVLQYLGRYTHRVALSNDRLVTFDGEQVRFRWRDYAHGNRIKLLTLEADEFIRRFILHVLPRGLMRIRHYGLAANRSKAAKLAVARAALNVPQPAAAGRSPEARNTGGLLAANHRYRSQPLPSLSSRYAAAYLRHTAGARPPGQSLMYHDRHILIEMRDRCSCMEPMRCLRQSPRPPHLITPRGPTSEHRRAPVRPRSRHLRVTHPPNSFGSCACRHLQSS